jgi:hypothetical protein
MNSKDPTIPFFVVDRPMSLNILKTSFVDFPDTTFGLMTHAHVTENFLKLFRNFPCESGGNCWLKSQRECCTRSSENKGESCSLGKRVNLRLVRMCDYGIFEKHGKKLSYEKLFDRYETVGANYGVMKDVFGDAKATIASAREAVREYKKKSRKFRLVLVAQGKTVSEYVWCYERLRSLGEKHIAIGGLLRRRPRSARYLYVSSDETLDQVLGAIRERFDPDWIFVLGVYHPSRHEILEGHGVYGSDYKGWIFNYEHRRSVLQRLHTKLSFLEGSRSVAQSFQGARTLRDRLASREERIRSEYVRARHGSEESSARKAASRKELMKIQGKLASADQHLLVLRQSFASKDGLPASYHTTLARFSRALRRSEQSMRVASVHKYLEKKVYNNALSNSVR